MDNSIANEIDQQPKKMTPERLRTFKGFENVTNEDAEQIITSIENFCRIICRHTSTKQKDDG